MTSPGAGAPRPACGQGFRLTPRERVHKALDFQPTDRVPRDLWYPVGIGMFRGGELDRILERYPRDFRIPAFRYGVSPRASGTPGVGSYVDSWGCEWECGEPGVTGEVKRPALSRWEDLDGWRPPWELLREADLSAVNRRCAETDEFVLLVFENETRPFERMQFLRGTENLLIDLAYGESDLYRLRDMLHEFFVREVEMWAATDIDGFALDDDQPDPRWWLVVHIHRQGPAGHGGGIATASAQHNLQRDLGAVG